MQGVNTRFPVGIVGYGAYIPTARLLTTEIDMHRGATPGTGEKSLGVISKSVPNLDEDAATLAVEAAQQAVDRVAAAVKMNIKKKVKTTKSEQDIGAVFVGSESHPYAVKPTGTIVAQALGLSENISLADLEFACKAGTQALQIGAAYVASGMCKQVLAVGTDTAQSQPGDALEYTAGAGAAAFIVGCENVLVEIIDTASIATDTPDFWRGALNSYPSHAGRFSAQPAYFAHLTKSVTLLLEKTKLSPKDIDYCVFHTPNYNFPVSIAKKLGFTQAQLAPSLLVDTVGNTYSAASLLALVKLLDEAEADKTILLASYGSGAGSDAFLLKTTKALITQRKLWRNTIAHQLKTTKHISYGEYQKRMEFIKPL